MHEVLPGHVKVTDTFFGPLINRIQSIQDLLGLVVAFALGSLSEVAR